jgi:hypothetical protein
MFTDRLNDASKTLCGFSFGGGSAVTASSSGMFPYARVVLLDAWLEFVADEGMLSRACAVPTLSVISEKWGANAKNENGHILKRAKKELYECEVPNSRHHDFSDVSFFLGFAKSVLGMTGKVDVRSFHAFNADLAARFIKRTSDALVELPEVVRKYSLALPSTTFRKWDLK